MKWYEGPDARFRRPPRSHTGTGRQRHSQHGRKLIRQRHCRVAEPHGHVYSPWLHLECAAGQTISLGIRSTILPQRYGPRRIPDSDGSRRQTPCQPPRCSPTDPTGRSTGTTSLSEGALAHPSSRSAARKSCKCRGKDPKYPVSRSYPSKTPNILKQYRKRLIMKTTPSSRPHAPLPTLHVHPHE